MRIVTADDSVDITAPVLKSNFRQLGHEVVAHAANGEEAVRLCREHRPDLAMFDVSMPRMNGDAAMHVVVAEGLAQYKALATSQGQKQFFQIAEQLGAGILIKPYSLGQMRKLLIEFGIECVDPEQSVETPAEESICEPNQ